MDLEVVGRHALLFDDDATSAFVNSPDALVDWHSLLIDRYDVRHLLSGPPPPRRRRNPQEAQLISSGSSLESELDQERYLDLPPPSDEQEIDKDSIVDGGGFHAVAFSYGSAEDASDQKNVDVDLGDSGFRPPFPLPESLLECLPPTEKVHQIIAKTAEFVSKHGGQSEIVLRVKQGDNPTFGFLMPDHNLHAYFRFLVDHQELLRSDIDGKSQDEKKADAEQNEADNVTGGALSLLGSVYGSGEDEDGAAEDAPAKVRVIEKGPDDISAVGSQDSKKRDLFANVNGKDDAPSKHLPPISKEKNHVMKKNPPISAFKAGTLSSRLKEGDTIGFFMNKSQASDLPITSKLESLVLEPPSDLKRLIDKIVEFILKNGQQFEAVLKEHDSKHGRFPFLLPANQYHPYYKMVLQKAQESRLTGKGFQAEDVSMGHIAEKKTSRSKLEADTLSLDSAGQDVPYDLDRKGKFKMVIGKSKKDGHDPPAKASQQQFGVKVDAAAVAAILHAASRGIKNPDLGILSSTSLNGNSHGCSSEGGKPSILGSHLSSQPDSVVQKSDQNGAHNISVPVAKAIAKTAAIEAASEADSSEAHLTKEEKLKAERLKRAKLFVAMLKTGAAPLKTESSRGASMEQQESVVSGSGAEVGSFACKEREGSSVPFDVDVPDQNEKSDKKYSDDDVGQKRSRRKYRLRSKEDEEDDEDGQEKDHKRLLKKRRSDHYSHEKHGEEDEDEELRNQKQLRKKHRSSRYEEEVDDEERDHRHYKRHRSHSSCEDGEENDEEISYKDSRKRSYRSKHEERLEEDEDERDRRHNRKKYHSSRSSREVREDDEEEKSHRDSRKKHRSYCSSHEEEDEEERDRKSSRNKHRSRNSSRHSRDKRKHKKRHSSKERESRHRHKHGNSSEDKHHLESRSDRSKERYQPEKEELEEGEISSKLSDQPGGAVGDAASREASQDLPNLHKDGGASLQPAAETTEVSDDLRAKVRAMLMATL